MKLNFLEHTKNSTKLVSKTMGILSEFWPILAKSSLLTLHKMFIRIQLDYADIIYDKAYIFLHS